MIKTTTIVATRIRCPSRPSSPRYCDLAAYREFPARYVIRRSVWLRLLLLFLQRPRTRRRPHYQGRRSLPQRSHTGGPTPFVVCASVLFLCVSSLVAAANATAAPIKPTYPGTTLGGFVKDRALARVLGETLF